MALAMVSACTYSADSENSEGGEQSGPTGETIAPTTSAPAPQTGVATAPATTGPTGTGVDGVPSEAADAAETCWTSEPTTGSGIAFEERTESYGLIEPLTGMYGHAVAAGDVNGDGWTDLFVAGFADRPAEQYQVRGATAPSPERLLLGGDNGFTIDPTFPGELARTSGATMADLDGDGDFDLVAVRNPRGNTETKLNSTVVYEQTDGGWRVGEPLLAGVAGRSIATPDVDRDGLPDLLVVADRFGGGSTRLLRNDGNLRFSDATNEWDIPDDLTGLALATLDLDLDGWSDIVVSGDRRVLMGGPNGFGVQVHEELAFELFGDEDDAAGIAVGDLNGDGRPDLVVGQHFNSTVDDGMRVPVRIFVNRETASGFELVDVTEESGSPALETKSPHVAIVDLDNDGISDVVTSAVSSSGAPIVLHGLGPAANGTPVFDTIGESGDGELLRDRYRGRPGSGRPCRRVPGGLGAHRSFSPLREFQRVRTLARGRRAGCGRWAR